ncbi:MAG: hypothetical protein E6R03_10335 [Hyphomicrobiaceae bacterium]|nr:MAG: hypothetical protein E6R03_10335 [Hyphomicrobiaceae bacterium]
MRTFIILAAILAVSPGCVYTKYEQHGVKLTRISFFGNQTVGKVDLSKGIMEGYASEQAEIAGAVVEAALRAQSVRK